MKIKKSQQQKNRRKNKRKNIQKQCGAYQSFKLNGFLIQRVIRNQIRRVELEIFDDFLRLGDAIQNGVSYR
jgi:hypothetical protein